MISTNEHTKDETKHCILAHVISWRGVGFCGLERLLITYICTYPLESLIKTIYSMNIPKHLDIFIKEMKRRNYSQMTIKNYQSNLGVFLNYFKSREHPLHLNEENIKEYLSQFNESNTQRSHHGAIKLYYEICLHQKNKFKYIPYCKKEKRSPIILSQEETQKLFDACSNVKHKTILYVAYATGVRVSELLAIKLTDIDRSNGVIHIMNGKGKKQRQVTMKPELLQIISDYWRIYKTKIYLFEGQFGGKYTSSSINQFLKKYALLAGIKKNVHIHLIRHLFASHSLEAGENLHITQKALGHSSPTTTANIYYHISPNIIANAFSPLVNLRLPLKLQPQKQISK